MDEDWHLWAQCRTKVGAVDAAALAHSRNRPTATDETRSSAIAEGPRDASVLSVVILPIATQQCRNYLYDKC